MDERMLDETPRYAMSHRRGKRKYTCKIIIRKSWLAGFEARMKDDQINALEKLLRKVSVWKNLK
jgi:hypothetical protein